MSASNGVCKQITNASPSCFGVLKGKNACSCRNKSKLVAFADRLGFLGGEWGVGVSFTSSLSGKIPACRRKWNSAKVPAPVTQSPGVQSCRGELDSRVHINFNKDQPFGCCKVIAGAMELESCTSPSQAALRFCSALTAQNPPHASAPQHLCSCTGAVGALLSLHVSRCFFCLSESRNYLQSVFGWQSGGYKHANSTSVSFYADC